MTIRVRAMQLSDIDSVFAIEIAAHQAPWTRDILRDCVALHYDCHVIEIDNASEVKLAGYIICRSHENSCHVLNLCIATALQGKGYGQYLLKNRLDALQATPIDSVTLEVRRSNLSAMHLYQKLGFEKVRIKRGYYRDGQSIEDAIVLKKNVVKI